MESGQYLQCARVIPAHPGNGMVAWQQCIAQSCCFSSLNAYQGLQVLDNSGVNADSSAVCVDFPRARYSYADRSQLHRFKGHHLAKATDASELAWAA